MNRTLFTVLVGALASGCTPSPMSQVELESLFERNIDSLNDLAAIANEHPCLRRIEKSREASTHYCTLNEADVSAEASARKILQAANFDFVSYWRNGSLPGNPLVYVDVPIYRWGLSLGGYYQSFRFIPFLEKYKPDATEHLSPLRLNGWYLLTVDGR